MSDKTEKKEKKELPMENKPIKTRKEKVIYMGVPIVERDNVGSIIFHIDYSTIYSNGLPKEVIERCKADSDFKKMFVPISEAGAVLRQMSQSESAFSQTRKELSKKYRKVRRG